MVVVCRAEVSTGVSVEQGLGDKSKVGIAKPLLGEIL